MGKLEKLIPASYDWGGESLGKNRHRVDRPATAARGPSKYSGVARLVNVASIGVDRIVRDPNQPREEFDQEGVERLAASMQSKGQLRREGGAFRPARPT
jgi:hypothetical protein